MHSPRSVQLVARKHHSKPPEGGCTISVKSDQSSTLFQHTAARRRLRVEPVRRKSWTVFQHTATWRRQLPMQSQVLFSTRSFNTQPHGGGCASENSFYLRIEGFNTQPREGGCSEKKQPHRNKKQFQHTAARRRLRSAKIYTGSDQWFQHTAARRRLPIIPRGEL